MSNESVIPDQYDSFYFKLLHDAYQRLSGEQPNEDDWKNLLTADSDPSDAEIEAILKEEPWYGPLSADSDPSDAVFEAIRYAAERDISPPLWTTAFLADGWERYRKHEVKSLDAAYGVKPHTNRRVRTNRRDPNRDLQMATQVNELRKQGLKFEEAVRITAESHHLSSKTVERAVTSLRKYDQARENILEHNPDTHIPDWFWNFP